MSKLLTAVLLGTASAVAGLGVAQAQTAQPATPPPATSPQAAPQPATTAPQPAQPQLPTVYIEQTAPKGTAKAPPKAPAPAAQPPAVAATPPVKAKAKAKAQSTAPTPTPVPPQAVEPPPAEETAGSPASIGVGTTGLAVPATTTTLTSQSLASQLPGTSDAAELLKGVAGVSIYQQGGVSGLPAINGLNDDRVKILLNGMVVTSACSNHMNPPMSYIDPNQVVQVDVIAGVTPVSKGGDSLGGTIVVESALPQFARPGEGVRTQGSVSGFYRSNNDRVGVAGQASAATETVSLAYAGAWTKADNYHRGSDGPEVLSTLYESQNQSLTFAARNGRDVFILQGVHEFIPYQGFVNQRMDMVDNEGKLVNARYLAHFDWGIVDTRAYWHQTNHMMDILADKKPGEMPMITDGTDVGYSVKAEVRVSGADIVRLGNEVHHQALDDYWPAVPGNMMMGPGTYMNITDGRRTRLGVFGEWERKWDERWSTQLGVRGDFVWMNTGDVAAYNMMNPMMNPDLAAANAFNARDHKRFDANLDLTALARYEPSALETYEVGYARKTRSPNLYERYAWGVGAMASSMIGWYGDANGYIGNLDLKPEIAHTISVTAGWHDGARKEWELKVTPYFTYVEDYIDADYVGEQTNMMGMPTGFVKMRFANHDARLMGVNVKMAAPLWSSPEAGRFSFAGTIGYVNGENLDSGDNLYNMMPLNARLALRHRLGGWSSAIEVYLVDEKDEVNGLRREKVTPSFGLVNLRTSYEWENVRIDLAVENLFDKLYYAPLGGVDWAGYKAGGQVMGTLMPVAGEGRSFNAGVTVKF